MKVVMIGPYPEPGRPVSGGVERVIDTLLQELASAVDLTLVVPSAANDAIGAHHGVRTIYLKAGRGPGALAYWRADARRVQRVVAELKPDLVHLQGVSGVGRLIGAPRILTVHGLPHRDYVTSKTAGPGEGLARHAVAHLLRAVEARARRQIGEVIVINPYVIEALPDVAGLRRFAIANPVDPVFSGALTSGDAARLRRILSVGRIGPRKNTGHAVALAARVLKGDAAASYAVVGPADDPAYLRHCRAFAGNGRAAARIKFPGSMTPERLRRELDRSSVLLVCSRQETAPVAIAEAHSRGVAVVAPCAFGIKHMITPGYNGFFLPQGDIDAQAAVLRKALDHPWDRAAIAAEARATYSPTVIAAQTLKAYRAVLGRDAAHAKRSVDRAAAELGAYPQ
jgi:glycosyltransferase involved in cell wall biosynthesis